MNCLAYVYMLRCRNGHIYTGYTTNLLRRIKNHVNKNAAKYTIANPPIGLIFVELVESKSIAMQREAAIKKLSKKQKEELANTYGQCVILLAASGGELNLDQIIKDKTKDSTISSKLDDDLKDARDQEIGKELRKWYRENKRDLPWRSDNNPYEIWLSEIMSQQTRIATLVPYFLRFIEKFPDIESLAQADEEQVLKAWEGLGYYSRARNIYKAAEIMVEQYQGKVPQDFETLLKLPGIGKYTAGAIASIAFQQKVVAVDGNVLRVVARIEAMQDDIALPATKKVFETAIRNWFPKRASDMGDFTQSLIELGALICLPKNPECEICPVKKHCKALMRNQVGDLPVKTALKKPKKIEVAVLMVQNFQGQWLVCKRKQKLLQHLWSFILIEIDEVNQQSAILEKLNEMSIETHKITQVGEGRHVFTHLIWEMKSYFCKTDQENAPIGFEFVNEQELQDLPWPTALSLFRDWAIERS